MANPFAKARETVPYHHPTWDEGMVILFRTLKLADDDRRIQRAVFNESPEQIYDLNEARQAAAENRPYEPKIQLTLREGANPNRTLILTLAKRWTLTLPDDYTCEDDAKMAARQIAAKKTVEVDGQTLPLHELAGTVPPLTEEWLALLDTGTVLADIRKFLDDLYSEDEPTEATFRGPEGDVGGIDGPAHSAQPESRADEPVAIGLA